jgi:hypothetical protein
MQLVAALLDSAEERAINDMNNQGTQTHFRNLLSGHG